MSFVMLLICVAAIAQALHTVLQFTKRTAGRERDIYRRTMTIRLVGGVSVTAVVGAFAILAPHYTEYLWFLEVGQGSVYVRRIVYPVVTFLVTFAFVFGLSFWLVTSTWKGAASPEQQWRTSQDLRSYMTFRGQMKWVCAGVCGLMGLLFASYSASNWESLILFLHSQSTNDRDPIYGNDVAFYMFTYPVLSQILGMGACLSTAIATVRGAMALGIRSRMNEISESFDEYSEAIGRTLSTFCGVTLACAAMWLSLGRFDLLWKRTEFLTGIDHRASTSGTALVWLQVAAVVILALLLSLPLRIQRLKEALWRGPWVRGLFAVPAVALIWCGYDTLVSFRDRSDPYAANAAYIQHHIDATRKAYALDKVSVKAYEPRNAMTYAELNSKGARSLTTLRLADWRAMSSAFQQNQTFEAYYRIPDIDVDRYTVDGKEEVLMLGSRELDLERVRARDTWRSERLIYTHGYGVVAASAVHMEPDGTPKFVIKDMPPVSTKAGIEVTRPEIYFGELTRSHVYVKTNQEEFSYPGHRGVHSHRYEGSGGVRVGWGLRRLALAWTFDGLRQLVTGDITSDSRLLWHREIHERIKTIAPFLTLDHDGYKVVRRDGTLWYLIDAYTTSTRYPYSRAFDAAGNNYIRNSVKVAIDAYNGTIVFYLTDPTDPIARAWSGVYPSLFRRLEDMPLDLLEHIRYPEDLFNIQSDILARYHLDASDFYLNKGLWQKPRFSRTDPETGESTYRTVDPYYLYATLPGERNMSYVLVQPFTADNRYATKAWLAAECDPSHYGKLVVYEMPEDRQTTGIGQYQTMMREDPEMSAALNLWDRGESEVIFGNPLQVPVADGLLFVQSVYLQARRDGTPHLARVAVGFANRIAWDSTLDGALRRLFTELENAPAPSGKEPQPAKPITLETVRSELDRYFDLIDLGEQVQAQKVLKELRQSLPK